MKIEHGHAVALRWHFVANQLLTWCSAALLTAGLVASQLLLGGWFYPALAAPGFLLVGLAAVAAGAAFWRTRDAPGAWCVGATLLFVGYLFWRQVTSPDAYAAREDAWLLLGALAVYLTVAWQLRGEGPRWLVLTVLFLMLAVQVGIVIVQFAADAAFHPLADLALRLMLPHGDEGMVNRGFVSGTLAGRGALSAVLQVTTFLALGMLVWGRCGPVVKILLLWVTAAGLAALVISLSRAAYLGAMFGLVVFALVSLFILNRGAAVNRFQIMVAAVVLIVLPLLLALSVGAESFLVRFRLEEIGGDTYREGLWFITARSMLPLDPWFGVGANMFDQMSLRYRAGAFDVPPIHAHNDWLQLLVEYGWIGLALGTVVFVVHFAAGWRNALRLAREAAPTGWLPQSMELGLVSGALAAWVAQAVHSFFDYRLHIAPVAMLLALCAGWLARARLSHATATPAWWLRLLGLMPAIPGVALVWWVVSDAPAEFRAIQAENALLRGEDAVFHAELAAGLALDPDNPRLLAMAAAYAGRQRGATLQHLASGPWAEECAANWRRFLVQRPFSAMGHREYGLAQTHRGLFADALPFHLRGIALDPDYATGYEYLGYYFLRRERYDEALRLFRMARRFPGAKVAPQEITALEEFVRGSGP